MNENKAKETARNGYQKDAEKELVTAIDPINENIESIATILRRMESEIDRHQRAVETVTAFLGRPFFLYVTLLFVAFWVCINIVLASIGLRSFDPVPFTWLLEAINLSSLLLTTVVLITQNRQEKATERRRHLDLQINLLVEKKVTKLIAMVEELRQELRKDLPSVQYHHDPEVEVMKQPVDPHEVYTSLNEVLNELAQDGEQGHLSE